MWKPITKLGGSCITHNVSELHLARELFHHTVAPSAINDPVPKRYAQSLFSFVIDGPDGVQWKGGTDVPYLAYGNMLFSLGSGEIEIYSMGF